MDGLDRQGLDARVLAGTRVAAIGPGTAAVLRDWGITADLVPERVDRGIACRGAGRAGRRGPARADPAGSGGARRAPARARAGRRRRAAWSPSTRPCASASTSSSSSGSSAADYVTFTSSSTVRFLLEAIGGVERFPRAGTRRVDRARDEPDRARPRPRGARGGRAPRRRRTRGRAAARRSGGRAGGVVSLAADLLPVRLRAPRRVGGRLPRRDRAHRARRDRDRHRARSAARPTSGTPHSCWRTRCRSFPPECVLAVVDPGVGTQAACALRCGPAAGRCWSAPTTACCGPRRRRPEASSRRST